MHHTSIFNIAEKIRIRKVKLNNNLYFPSNHTTNKINLIGSNQRYNKEQYLNNINHRTIIKINNEKKKKLNKGIQSELTYRNLNNIYLPILPKGNFKTYRNINKNFNKKFEETKMKNILNPNPKHEIAINPVSLNLEKNNSQKLIQIRGKMKEKFFQRVRNYRRRIKKEIFDSNYSINCTQNIFNNNKENTFLYNTNNYLNYINANNKNSFKDLNKLYKPIKRARIFNQDNNNNNISYYTINIK